MHHQTNRNWRGIGIGVIVDDRHLVFCTGANGIRKINAGDTVQLNDKTRNVRGVREYLTFAGAVEYEGIAHRHGNGFAKDIVGRLMGRFNSMETYWLGVIVLELDIIGQNENSSM